MSRKRALASATVDEDVEDEADGEWDGGAAADDDAVVGDAEEEEEEGADADADGEDDYLDDEEEAELAARVPAKATRYRKRASAAPAADVLFPLGDYSSASLLPDHMQRPIWLTDDGQWWFATRGVGSTVRARAHLSGNVQSSLSSHLRLCHYHCGARVPAAAGARVPHDPLLAVRRRVGGIGHGHHHCGAHSALQDAVAHQSAADDCRLHLVVWQSQGNKSPAPSLLLSP